MVNPKGILNKDCSRDQKISYPEYGVAMLDIFGLMGARIWLGVLPSRVVDGFRFGAGFQVMSKRFKGPRGPGLDVFVVCPLAPTSTTLDGKGRKDLGSVIHAMGPNTLQKHAADSQTVRTKRVMLKILKE